MKQFILIFATILMGSGCLTMKLKERIENQDLAYYKVNSLNELKSGFNSQGDLVIHNLQNTEPKNFCIKRSGGRFHHQLLVNGDTHIERDFPTFNINESVGNEQEYLRITKKTDESVTFLFQEKGKRVRTIEVGLQYPVSPSTARRVGLKMLYPLAIIGDIAIVGLFIMMQAQ